MLFQTQFFILVFLPLGLIAYYALADSAVWRQWSLIVTSLIFYGWWDVRFVPLLLGQIGMTWALANLHERTKSRWLLTVGIVGNLASLGTFKYLTFLLTSFSSFTGLPTPRPDIVLPIGISFFTFQLISYLVDRMRNDAPIYPLRRFALFVLLFPHLIAGPIVRHNELIPQFDIHPRLAGFDKRFGIGLILFSIGLLKKVLLADRIAEVINPIFERAAGGTLSFGESWSALLGFSMQIFLDFSAYTDMAIGIALLFGLLLPENFFRPYLATNIRDFWRRWHMSLSRFLRDYLYVPLGGSRAGTGRFVFATVVTMALCGLWHGAGWTFVIWGLWHALGLLVCRGWQSLAVPLPAIVGWVLTMLFVIFGWVLFRAPDLPTSVNIFGSMVGLNGFGGSLLRADIMGEALLACLLIPSSHQILETPKGPRLIVAVTLAALAAYCVLQAGKGAPAEFIYFRF